MAAVRATGNKATELRLAAILRAYDITGWRRHQTLPGRPDFVFATERLAVFVARDRLTNFSLKKAGWRVLRVWEHSLKEPSTVAHRIISRLSAARNQCIHTGGIYERRT